MAVAECEVCCENDGNAKEIKSWKCEVCCENDGNVAEIKSWKCEVCCENNGNVAEIKSWKCEVKEEYFSKMVSAELSNQITNTRAN